MSNEDTGHKQSSEGGEGQGEPRGPGQARRGVAQVGGAARLVHAVDSAAVGAWEVGICCLVAINHF